MPDRASGVRRGVDAALLVVEDDLDIRDVVVDLLTDAGYVVRTARTLTEAREVVARSLPAALILDLNLPDGSSEELLAELAAAKVRVPAVIMTATVGGPEVATRHGAEFLQKPFAIEELLAIVARLTRTSAASSKR